MGGLSVIIAFLLLGALWFAAVLNEHDIHPMRRLVEWMRHCSSLELALVASMVAGPIYRAGSKTNGVNGVGGGLGGGANVANVEMLPMANANIQLVPGTELGNGNIGTGNNYTMATLITNTDWLAFGGYEDWFPVDESAWCFRFGSNLVERLTVFSCGEISPAPYDASNRISLLGLPLSIAPAANWHLLGNGDWGTGNGSPQPSTLNPQQSLFCHEETPSNTLLLTWVNALVNRDTNLPVTVQAELFPDGAAAFRYDFSGIGDINALSNAEAQIWRDGVLASDYQLPTIDYQLSTTNYQLNSFFDALPITGTNLIGEVYARIAGGNSNAYYCADVVVEKGPAKIRVEPLGVETNQGLLGTYEIVAMPGETNRLPLLIGPKYAVTAESAFGSFELVPPPFVPLADDTGTVERLSFSDAFSATNITDRLVEIQWSVEFALEEIDATPEATTYALRVTPDWLDGVVTWHGIADTNAPPMRGALPMRSGGASCSCGCLVRDGLDLIHYLSCECEHCYAKGECSYEGHTERIGLDMKDPPSGGGGNSPDGGSGNQPNPDLPSVSVSFEKKVLLFEAPYENAPGETNTPASRQIKLMISVNGGENGVMLIPEIGGEFQPVDGNDPIPNLVLPGEQVDWEGYYRGIAASAGENRALALVRLRDAVTGEDAGFGYDRATVVKITIWPEAKAPGNRAEGRHTLGVCEVVNCLQSPSAPRITWAVSHGEMINGMRYVCPLYATSDPLQASIGDVSYVPSLTVVAPQGIEARDARPVGYGRMEGLAGYIGMAFDLHVLPLTVSFQNIAVEEVPNELGGPSGYFTNAYFSAYWHHNRFCGAGDWRRIGTNNYFMTDIPVVSISFPRMRGDGTLVHSNDTTVGWQNGQLIWEDPFGWNVTNVAATASEYGTFATGTRQETFITSDGTVTLRKFGHEVIRGTNGIPILNGVIQYVNE